MSSTIAADHIVDRLVDWDVRRVFGYPGDGVDPILGALHRQEDRIELVTARHEEMAAFMAGGHAKYGGGVGVCLATQGPGAVHLLAGLYDAKLDRRPVVAIVGQVTSTALGSGYQQEVDLHTLFKDVCAQYLQTVSSPQQLPHVLDNAFRTALATSSPTCVIIPHDVQTAESAAQEDHGHGIVPTSTAYARGRALPGSDQLRAAADLLADGRRVAVLAGQGAAGAERQLRDVVERLGAGLTTSLLGKPLLDESLPYHCGVMGHLGTTASADLMNGCDTLLIVGSNDPWTEFYPRPDQARAVQIDVTARNIGTKFPVDVALVGDAAATLDALLPLLPDEPGWRPDVERAVADWHDVARRRLAEEPDRLNPQFLVGELSGHLPADAQVAVDVGSVTYWYARFLRLPDGVPAHLSSTFASMGSAMPYGIAAKLLHPDRPVVALAGDGAMQMNGLSELITVADRWQDWPDPRFVVVVLNNGDLAEVSWEQREMEGEPRFPASQAVPSFPYAAYAELLGLRGLRVERPEQVGEVWSMALSADRPVLVEALVDPDVPLLPPRQPEEKVARTADALDQESDGDQARGLLREQRAGER
ncbi:thiamine pyrophosphate-requiring protein [Myceligenerans salitolerans]|uniref:Thiamine pyrophosphate-requiring protein n=1 Tax=Myceligenerans salitolerans TaxID=1230528 RepID=A0ABS3I7V9_9MICO|nr:thiamine pyrophosphate-requiring protein [Myceligenerans salitolerans]MBO0609020.1 thiamine pyrophosphate-requiring protein [Myceligenerans salitolerans]